MNLAYNSSPDQDFEADDRFSSESKEKLASRTRRSQFRPRKSPALFNGIHRRRTKRPTW